MLKRPIEKQDKITVIDSMMGSGKTSFAIQLMQEAPVVQRFIYITPFLTEVERIKTSVTNRDFKEPTTKNSDGTKLKDFKNLLQQGADIVSTHSLFYRCDNEVFELLQRQNYILVLDEAMAVVEQVKMNDKDLETLIQQNFIAVDDVSGLVTWTTDPNYNGRFADIKEKTFNGNLYRYSDRKKLFLWTFPVNIFESFDRVFIMTYMFKAQLQRYYFDMHGVQYELKSVKAVNERYELTQCTDSSKYSLKPLINVYEGNLNDVGQDYYALSATKLRSLKKQPESSKLIQNGIYNYFRNVVNGKSEENMWTTLKDAKSLLKGNRYTKGFVECNARATNEYGHKRNLAYILNRFPDTVEQQFFEKQEIKFDTEAFALSEMIQWIFRSAIRNGEQINLYIPSSRMRSLLNRWLNDDVLFSEENDDTNIQCKQLRAG
ncbi:MAG: hypothetical protein N3I35_02215 [Clostridia bacterium]|nr:hypothetical protein [Clostridia bacterium]